MTGDYRTEVTCDYGTDVTCDYGTDVTKDGSDVRPQDTPGDELQSGTRWQDDRHQHTQPPTNSPPEQTAQRGVHAPSATFTGKARATTGETAGLVNCTHHMEPNDQGLAGSVRGTRVETKEGWRWKGGGE